MIGGLALTFAFFEPTPWRRWTIVAAVVSWLLGLSVVEWWRSRRLGLAAVNLAFNYYAPPRASSRWSSRPEACSAR
ncbi:MAG: hypothetical protein R3B82_03645 [Sandaracinaceae bacterium]